MLGSYAADWPESGVVGVGVGPGKAGSVSSSGAEGCQSLRRQYQTANRKATKARKGRIVVRGYRPDATSRAMAFLCVSPYTRSTPPARTARSPRVKNVSRSVSDGGRVSSDPPDVEPV